MEPIGCPACGARMPDPARSTVSMPTMASSPTSSPDITLNGRPNSGAALGNIAYDRKHRQLFVSDLETGMIHRIDAESGKDLGHFDHGAMGRTRFLDAWTNQSQSLPPVTFDPKSSANLGSC